MIKIDLHSHSIISPDGAGSITASDFEELLRQGQLGCIAITDHNEIRLAIELHKKHGDKIIVGEEITTADGEMIGLFLVKTIPAGLSAKETAKAIHAQGGLVYIPHPFETFRKGLQKKVLEELVSEIDIFEVFNGRGRMRGKAKEAEEFAQKYNLVAAASSDAHGLLGLGKTYSLISKLPDRNSLTKLLREGKLQKTYAPILSYLYPMVNMIKKKVNLRK